MNTDATNPRPPISAAGLKVPARKPEAPTPPAQEPPAPRTSAAGLTVPKRTPAAQPVPAPSAAVRRKPLSTAEANARYDRLRALRDSMPADVNKNDRAVALISACISSGIRSERDIVGALYHLNFERYHVTKMLERNAGATAVAARWKKGTDGRYTLLG